MVDAITDRINLVEIASSLTNTPHLTRIAPPRTRQLSVTMIWWVKHGGERSPTRRQADRWTPNRSSRCGGERSWQSVIVRMELTVSSRAPNLVLILIWCNHRQNRPRQNREFFDKSRQNHVYEDKATIGLHDLVGETQRVLKWRERMSRKKKKDKLVFWILKF